jgi:hypothetical protein
MIVDGSPRTKYSSSRFADPRVCDRQTASDRRSLNKADANKTDIYGLAGAMGRIFNSDIFLAAPAGSRL